MLIGASATGLRSAGIYQDPEISTENISQTLNSSLNSDVETDDPLEAYTDEQLEALRMERLQNEFDAVQAAYRNIRKAKAEPNTTEQELYPQVYSAYELISAYLDKLDAEDTRRGQVREMLRDLDNELQYGAYFYSSQKNNQEMAKFARAFVDIQLMPDFKDMQWRRDENFANIVYICASDAYNKKDFENAINYFRLYFKTGAEEYREKVYMFMGQACINTKKYDLAVAAMTEGARLYPQNEHIIGLGLQACIEGGYGERIQDLLNQALILKPNDEALLNIQGRLLEDEGKYTDAINVFTRLDQMKPNNLKITQHLAMNYYNLGVSNYNEAIRSEDEKVARKYNRLAKDYFSGATELLRTVIGSDPTSVKYLTALAVAYNCLDNSAAFEDTNSRIVALGGKPVSNIYMPPVMTANENNTVNYERTGIASSEAAVDVPPYASYASEYVTSRLNKWSKKGEFERQADYLERVNDESIRNKYDELSRECAEEYLRLYTSSLRINDLKLQPYDTENETFMIESAYGPMLLRVPMKNNEAETFKSNWSQIHFQAPKFYINSDGNVRIGSMNFTTPQGKTYAYSDDAGLQYGSPAPVVDFESILGSTTRKNQVADHNSVQPGMMITVNSDVDVDIPQVSKANPNTVALIIANEKYSNVPQVDYATHDGDIFRQYCIKTLGIPESNVRFINNATFGQTLGAIDNLSSLVKSMDNPDVIVYYAGHGIPDDATKDAFLLPVDGTPGLTATSLSLDKFYKELGELPAGKVTLFLDACFSGGTRNGAPMSSTRAVAIAPKAAAPKGNMFILSATSAQETAMPYAEKAHGMFTYFLLKKLRESKGNCSLEELSDYVISNVRLESNRVNKKQQTPTVSRSGSMIDGWKKEKLRK